MPKRRPGEALEPRRCGDSPDPASEREDLAVARAMSVLRRTRGGVPRQAWESDLLSVEDGLALGADARLLADDANLAAMCEACNLGLLHAQGSVLPKTYASIMFRLIQARQLRSEVESPNT